jgi:hypothetical protein
MKEGILGTERGSIRWLSVEKSRWKTLWACRKTDRGMMINEAGFYEVL